MNDLKATPNATTSLNSFGQLCILHAILGFLASLFRIVRGLFYSFAAFIAILMLLGGGPAGESQEREVFEAASLVVALLLFGYLLLSAIIAAFQINQFFTGLNIYRGKKLGAADKTMRVIRWMIGLDMIVSIPALLLTIGLIISGSFGAPSFSIADFGISLVSGSITGIILAASLWMWTIPAFFLLKKWRALKEDPEIRALLDNNSTASAG